MHIRQERGGDEGVIRDIHAQAFGGDAEARLVDRIRSSFVFVAQLSLVAEVDGVPVGHILLSPVQITPNMRYTRLLALAPLAVLPSHQRHGIGAALTTHALQAAAVLRYQAVVVVGHPEYYPKFGFVLAKQIGLKLPFDVPEEAFLVKQLCNDALKNVKGKIQYPSAFDEVIVL